MLHVNKLFASKTQLVNELVFIISDNSQLAAT